MKKLAAAILAPLALVTALSLGSAHATAQRTWDGDWPLQLSQELPQ